MVAPCCCGISLMRGTQYVAVADVVLAILNISAITAHLDYSDEPYHFRFKNTYYDNIRWIPQWLAITVIICHIMQFFLGIFLYVAARSKNRTGCFVWMWLTAPTILFTWIWVLVRLYELAVVYEFTEELKQEQEVTYFPGYKEGQQQQQDQSLPKIIHPDPYNNNMNSPVPMEPNVSIINPPAYAPIQNYAYYGLYQHQNYIPPPALQPPQYDAITMEHHNSPFYQYPDLGGGNNYPRPTTSFSFPQSQDKSSFAYSFK